MFFDVFHDFHTCTGRILSAPWEVLVSSLEPLKSLQNKLFNGSRLDIGSVGGAEIRRKQIRENARFTRICAFFCAFRVGEIVALRALPVSRVGPLESLRNKLSNGTRLDIGSVRGAEIRRRQFHENLWFSWKIANFAKSRKVLRFFENLKFGLVSMWKRLPCWRKTKELGIFLMFEWCEKKAGVKHISGH